MKTGILNVLYKIKFLFIPYLVILSICLIIKLLYTQDSIYFAVNTRHFEIGDWFFAIWTNMGDGITLILLSLIITAFNYRKGLLVGSSYLLTSIIAQALKRVFNTPRPVLYFKNDLSRLYLIKGVNMLETLSFPSGHSTSAFAGAVVLTYITPKKSWGVLYLILALLVAYSRMYLSEHFFEDVVAGSAIGVFVTIFWISWLDGKPFLRSGKWNKGLIKI